MSGWREFELEWTDYLSNKYGELASFEHVGDADSTSPDIKVTTKNGKSFNIEVKKCPAQCGQFVLFPDDKNQKFAYSKQNALPMNKHAKRIVEYMNQNYETFKNPGKGGANIIFDNSEDVFTSWIIETYKNKGVELFGTNDYKLFPLEDISKHFVITAKYRIKRSGSRGVGVKSFKTVIGYIKKNYHLSSYQTTNNGKLFFQSSNDFHRTKFAVKKDNYMFAKSNNGYEIRKLSKTNNKNVIFSVKIKKDAPLGMNEEEIKNYLK